MMEIANLFEAYMEQLLAGSRRGCRQIVQLALQQGVEAKVLYQDVLWRAMERIERLWKEDRINSATEHMATRINRMVANQLQAVLADVEPVGKKALVLCAAHEQDELGGHIIADMLEAQGWEVFFLGGGVPDDEVLMLVGLHRPDLLVVYWTRGQGIPAVRGLIENIRQIDPYPQMNIMLTGGIFSRAEGLWEEIKADLYAPDLQEAIRLACSAEPRDPQAEPNRLKRRRRRRRQLVEPVGAVI